jgi:hypothetical protein
MTAAKIGRILYSLIPFRLDGRKWASRLPGEAGLFARRWPRTIVTSDVTVAWYVPSRVESRSTDGGAMTANSSLLREQLVNLLRESTTSAEEDLLALGQCAAHIRNRRIVGDVADVEAGTA